jgi:hypothetical protein
LSRQRSSQWCRLNLRPDDQLHPTGIFFGAGAARPQARIHSARTRLDKSLDDLGALPRSCPLSVRCPVRDVKLWEPEISKSSRYPGVAQTLYRWKAGSSVEKGEQTLREVLYAVAHVWPTTSIIVSLRHCILQLKVNTLCRPYY